MKYPYRVFKALKIACELDEIDQRIVRIVDGSAAFNDPKTLITNLEKSKKEILKTFDNESENRISNTISWDDGDSGWQNKIRQRMM